MQLLKDPSLLKKEAYLNGQWQSAAERFAVTNPATGEVLAQVSNLPRNQTEATINAAHTAFLSWRKLTAKARHKILLQWFQLIVQHQEDLARIMTLEQGKPLSEARGEVIYAASFVEWFAEEAKRINGDVLQTFDANRRLMVLRQPVGVCAAITPWNFPLAMITRKVAPALAAGCSVLIKPAEQTPLSALALAELAHRAGVPAGVFNVLTADAARSIEVGAILCASPIVRHLSFTGSTEVGRILMQQCAPTLKKMSLELGGNAAFIVFDDADLDAAVDGAIASKFRNAGQTCVCANRFFVQAGVYDAFIEKFKVKVAALTVGNGLDEGVLQGPLIDAQALDKVRSHVADALALGAQVVVGGSEVTLPGASEARCYQPTILRDANTQMRCAREETFGPVAPIFRFEHEADVIALANATEFGLSSYFYSRDISRVWRVAEALECGIIGVNTGIISTEVAPFGGVKSSGFGREGSSYGIDEYSDIKYVCVGNIDR